MKKLLWVIIVVTLVLSVSVGLVACKKFVPIETDFEDVPEDAVIAEGLSALTVFNDAIENTYAGDFKRVNTLDFATEAPLVGTQSLDEVSSYYKVGNTFMRTLIAKGDGVIAKDNTAIKLFYNDGEAAKVAEKSYSKLAINFDTPDYTQVEDLVEVCTDIADRMEDYLRFTSYIRTTEKLASDHVDEVYEKDGVYYATIKFDMNVGTTNSGIQPDIDDAVEEATNSIPETINWQQDTTWNCIFIKQGNDFYLKKTYLYESYEGKSDTFVGEITAPCNQLHISEFSYGEDIDMPAEIITLLGMD